MAVFKLIQMWWYARCRRLDMEYLWPTCCQIAPDPFSAKVAFARHCVKDRAWRALGEEEVQHFLDNLEFIDGTKTQAAQGVGKKDLSNGR
jgi:hypothetical protein